MPQQSVIDWTTLANRSRLSECGLSQNEIDMVLLVIQQGEAYTSGDDRRWVLRMSTRAMAAELGISNSTVRAVARRLATRTTADGEPVFSDRDFDATGVYRVSQQRINALAFSRDGPVQHRDGLDRPPGRDWAGATHNQERLNNYNQAPSNQSQINRYRVRSAQLAAHPDPWSELTDADLRLAGAELLEALFETAADKGWCRRDETMRQAFFGLAIHAATTAFKTAAAPGKEYNRRVRVLIGNLKNGRFNRISVAIRKRVRELIRELDEAERSTGASSLCEGGGA